MHTPKYQIETLPNGLSFKMILVEGGSFMMGCDDDEASDKEKPIHQVSVNNFFLGELLVTQELWKAILKTTPSSFKGIRHPVETVSWNATKEFLKKLNRITQKTYRLPTEAEWEFSARGGINSEEYVYAGSDRLKEVSWYSKNSDFQPHPLGGRSANELGLYDMSGNIREWVEDQWHSNYKNAPVDGSAWVDSVRWSRRVLRGGSWFDLARNCRVSYRRNDFPGLRRNRNGFRLALSLPD